MSKNLTPRFPVRSQTRLTQRVDSTRWDHYRPREDDVIVATYPKCGTTWMEHIVLNLVHYDANIPRIKDVAPWIDRRQPRGSSGPAEGPIEEVIEMMERQTHLRQMKTHLPLDCLPYYPQVKYLVVGRDARDACMSYNNHELLQGRIDGTEDIGDYWRGWITEGGGDQAHSLFNFYEQWWEYRNLDNVLLVHYADMKQNLKSEIYRVSRFLEIDATEEKVDFVREATTFTSMKSNSEKLGLRDGHINKGTNGRWRDVLSEEDLKLYKPVAERSASPDCIAWIEGGRAAVEP